MRGRALKVSGTNSKPFSDKLRLSNESLPVVATNNSSHMSGSAVIPRNWPVYRYLLCALPRQKLENIRKSVAVLYYFFDIVLFQKSDYETIQNEMTFWNNFTLIGAGNSAAATMQTPTLSLFMRLQIHCHYLALSITRLNIVVWVTTRSHEKACDSVPR